MSTPRKPLGEAEFNQLFHTYHKPVFLYLRTLLARRGHPPDPHLVEDLTQEAFTILWEKQESFLAGGPQPLPRRRGHQAPGGEGPHRRPGGAVPQAEGVHLRRHAAPAPAGVGGGGPAAAA